MNNSFEYNISYDSMRKIIKNYYAENGKEVTIRIHNDIDDDRFAGMIITTVEVIEEASIAGEKVSSKTYLDGDDLKKIMKEVLAKENKELIDLTNNANVQTKIEGYYMDEHEKQYIANKSFTVTVREKGKVYTK